MRLSLEDLFGWTSEDAHAAIHASLPEGWSFKQWEEDGWWVGHVLDEQGRVAFQDRYPDAHLGLFNVFGYLVNRMSQEIRHPMWARGGREDYRAPRAPRVRTEEGGPGDLDPDEVAMVYSRRP